MRHGLVFLALLELGLRLRLEEHSLDGVDFDWEAPRNDEEMANYVLLLRAASRALRSKNKLVTVALHPGQSLKTARLPGDGDVGSPYDYASDHYDIPPALWGEVA